MAIFAEIPNAPRVVATAGNYLELIAGLRARVAELGISYSTVDQIAGWTDTYATKLLAEEPGRNLGPMSLDALVGALGLKIVLVEDLERLEKARRHRDFVPRKHRPRRPRAVGEQAYVAHRITRSFLLQIASKGGVATREKLSDRRREQIARNAARARAAKLSPEQRSALAKKASHARWKKSRAWSRSSPRRDLPPARLWPWSRRGFRSTRSSPDQEAEAPPPVRSFLILRPSSLCPN
jgi:hypothetical protein